MTVLANITDIVPTEEIEDMILESHRSVPVALTLAWGRSVGRGSGNNVQIARRNGVTTNAGTKAELANFALVNSTTDSVNISGGWVGHSDQVSWESDTHGIKSSLQLVIVDGVEALVDRVDVDGLAIGASASQSSDFSGQPLTEARVLTAKAAYNAQRPHKGMRGMVLSTAQVRDWGLDLIANGGRHLGGDAESQRVADMLGSTADGYLGMRHKLAIFESDNVAIAAGDATGFICKMGLGGPLGYRSWAVISWESEWKPRGKFWEITVAANYGWGLIDENNIRGIVSQAA
jgi:hypothetical protein